MVIGALSAFASVAVIVHESGPGGGDAGGTTGNICGNAAVFSLAVTTVGFAKAATTLFAITVLQVDGTVNVMLPVYDVVSWTESVADASVPDRNWNEAPDPVSGVKRGSVDVHARCGVGAGGAGC